MRRAERCGIDAGRVADGRLGVSLREGARRSESRVEFGD
jgi:hypothetical protein